MKALISFALCAIFFCSCSSSQCIVGYWKDVQNKEGHLIVSEYLFGEDGKYSQTVSMDNRKKKFSGRYEVNKGNLILYTDASSGDLEVERPPVKRMKCECWAKELSMTDSLDNIYFWNRIR